MPHYFTREEAEALLPQISVVLRDIQAIDQQLQSHQRELDALKIQAMGNGHHLRERAQILQERLLEQAEQMQSALDTLHTFGCVLKDPASGLIDFLTLREGQEVYLCWHLDEERILYWHPLDTGFAGRQPL